MYSLSLNDIRQGHLREVFIDLEFTLKKLNINFYLIGAIARDIWISGVHKIKTPRFTKDLDLAVMVSSNHEYENLKNQLLITGKFKPVKDVPHKLIFKNQYEIDLLPFGAIEKEEMVILNGAANITLSAAGFSLIYDTALDVVQLENHYYKVCTIPGIVILKLFAYFDRPEERGKDILDISFIVQNYYYMAIDDIMDNHLDLIETSEIDELSIGARVLGRHIRPILNDSPTKKQFILDKLNLAVKNPRQITLTQLLIQNHIDTLEKAVKILKTLINGIEDYII
jgi:predicted nucleotidyltransferase